MTIYMLSIIAGTSGPWSPWKFIQI